MARIKFAIFFCLCCGCRKKKFLKLMRITWYDNMSRLIKLNLCGIFWCSWNLSGIFWCSWNLSGIFWSTWSYSCIFGSRWSSFSPWALYIKFIIFKITAYNNLTISCANNCNEFGSIVTSSDLPKDKITRQINYLIIVYLNLSENL